MLERKLIWLFVMPSPPPMEPQTEQMRGGWRGKKEVEEEEEEEEELG